MSSSYHNLGKIYLICIFSDLRVLLSLFLSHSALVLLDGGWKVENGKSWFRMEDGVTGMKPGLV